MFESDTEVTINNMNSTLILRKIRFCNCFCKKEPKIIDLNQIEKICIFSNDNSGIKRDYIIIYKNATNENIRNYFCVCAEKSLADSENLFKKYFTVENTMPQIMDKDP